MAENNQAFSYAFSQKERKTKSLKTQLLDLQAQLNHSLTTSQVLVRFASRLVAVLKTFGIILVNIDNSSS